MLTPASSHYADRPVQQFPPTEEACLLTGDTSVAARIKSGQEVLHSPLIFAVRNLLMIWSVSFRHRNHSVWWRYVKPVTVTDTQRQTQTDRHTHKCVARACVRCHSVCVRVCMRMCACVRARAHVCVRACARACMCACACVIASVCVSLCNRVHSVCDEVMLNVLGRRPTY